MMKGALWLLGTHIAESPSPAMHNAALEALGRPPSYALRTCSPEALHEVLDAAETSCMGVNVTMPHKMAVAKRYEAVLSTEARLAGAVNAVVFREGAATQALNTDVEGLRYAWQTAGIDLCGQHIQLLGAGGAARAVVVAAAASGVRSVSVMARRQKQAAELEALATRCGLRTSRTARSDTHVVVASPEVPNPHILLDALALPSSAFVHDLRYGPKTEALRAACAQRGPTYQDGTSMLVGQGVCALEAFLGQTLPANARYAMQVAAARHMAMLSSK